MPPRPPPAPKDARTRGHNRTTQPRTPHRVFCNPGVVPVGWYPVCGSDEVRRGEAVSRLIAAQRLVVWRGADDGRVRCLDAFCPHMGADLANGRVVGDALQCYFHQWRFGGDGALQGVACGEAPEGVRTRAWPVEEAYGLVWAWAGDTPDHGVPRPPGLEGAELTWHRLGRVTLYAHHHAMIAGGLDVQHFATVHGLSADFDIEVVDHGDRVVDWHMRGHIPPTGWRGRLGQAVLGDRFTYVARVAEGSVVTLTYGPDARWRGTGRALPSAHILWGCVPREDGVSDVEIVLVAPRGRGVLAGLRSRARLLATAGLLGVLQDDDVKAFPHNRFGLGRMTPLDANVLRLVRTLESLPLSDWSGSQRWA